MKRSLKLALLASAVMVPLVMLQGCNMGQYEEPAFTASAAEDSIELRHYKPVIAAEVEVTGTRKESINQGFRLIADYIFGNNAPNAKIAMTTPVIQQAAPGKGETIAMTTPVIQQGNGASWKVRFIMPSEYTLATLPKPNNPAVKLREVKAKTFVVNRFSGATNDDAKIAEKTEALKKYIAAHKLKTTGEPVLAFYDPPWTLWFLRRNEVMIEVVK